MKVSDWEGDEVLAVAIMPFGSQPLKATAPNEQIPPCEPRGVRVQSLPSSR